MSRCPGRSSGPSLFQSSDVVPPLQRQLGALLLAGAIPLAVGGQQAPEIPVFEETVDVNLVNVEVVVLHNGEPVRGLTIDDFEIWDDDKRVEITNFRASDDDEASELLEAEAGEPARRGDA